MPQDELFAARKSLDEICVRPEKIISVYSLEKHVWADSNSDEARGERRPELQTIAEFQIDPVRSFLNEILRIMAAPYRPERRDQSIGQGYWIQAEFGSGKSHLLCFLSALALGSREAWIWCARKNSRPGAASGISVPLLGGRLAGQKREKQRPVRDRQNPGGHRRRHDRRG